MEIQYIGQADDYLIVNTEIWISFIELLDS